MARYCNATCQKKDWKVHKLLHQDIEHAVNIESMKISEAAAEEKVTTEATNIAEVEEANITEIDEGAKITEIE